MKIIKSIFFGVIAAFGALFIEMTLFYIIFFLNTTLMVLSAAVIEEILKFLVIFKGLFKTQNSGDIFHSSLFLGLGFALTELALKNPIEISAMPGLYWQVVGLFLIHILTAGLMGYFLAKIKRTGFMKLSAIVIFTACLHSAYNFAIIYGYLQK